MNFRERYGTADRLLHDVAFRTADAQRALADVEEMVFRDRLDGIRLDDPVFITGLPRSGTTILLKLLCETGRFASHLYRDMPFLLCPVLWERFSRRFAVDDRPKERAHGDGIQISIDSPEAFEERIWKQFWPSHYCADRIRPWSVPDRNPRFEAFMESHMRKIVALRRDGPADERRYLSKNNLNIARLSSRPGPLDRGIVLIPFREPLQQAASMRRQHRRFSRIHARDDFVRRYMEAIGHHEFGKGLKPVDFGGWLEGAPDPDGLEFWLRYWIAAYRHALEAAGPSTRFVSYGGLVEDPEDALARLSAAVGVDRADLTGQAGRVRPPRSHDVDESDVPGALLDEATRLHDQLVEVADV